jgi:O-antigen/teichoic acid export membrane protein
LNAAKNQPEGPAGSQLLGGTLSIFAAEALLVPVGVLTAAFLSRRFGPEEYGLLTLASVLVVWLESNVAAALSRPAIKLIGDAEDWHTVGSAVLRLYLLAGCGLGLLLWAISNPLAALFGEQALAGYLRLLAIDVPLFCLAQAHRSIIVGLGRFRERAFISASRWVARLLLVVVFVELNGAPASALWGSVCASLVELIICRLYVRPRLFAPAALPVRRLCGYALPLVASALCLSLYGRLDLLLLKALGRSAREAGIYSVAQNLALLPSLFSFAFAPALLSTLSRALRDGRERRARRIGREAMRAVLLLLPVAAITAGAAPELVLLIFGREFLPAATPLRLLIFGSLALLMIAVTTSVMTAAGKLNWTLHTAWPILLGALAGHLMLIPLAGAVGAALVTSAVACAGALMTVWLVYKLWRVAPSAGTLWRVAAVSVAAYALTALLPAPGFLLALKLAGAVLFALLALMLLGEFSAAEISSAWATLRRRARPVIEAEVSAS